MNNGPAFRIRKNIGSRTRPCCRITGFICQMPTVQVEFLELVNESDWRMSFKTHRSKSFLNDCRTIVTDSWNIRIRDKFLLLLHMVRLHSLYTPCDIMTIMLNPPKLGLTHEPISQMEFTHSIINI